MNIRSLKNIAASLVQLSRNSNVLSRYTYPVCGLCQQRFSSFHGSSSCFPSLQTDKSLLKISPVVPQVFTGLHPVLSGIQCRTYKEKNVLKLRCDGCYFEKRDGRWYVECTVKPRHKQMQLLSKRYLFKDDYSKGNVKEAMYWKFNKRERIYWLGNNKYARHDWTGERIAKIV